MHNAYLDYLGSLFAEITETLTTCPNTISRIDVVIVNVNGKTKISENKYAWPIILPYATEPSVELIDTTTHKVPENVQRSFNRAEHFILIDKIEKLAKTFGAIRREYIPPKRDNEFYLTIGFENI